MDEPKWDSPIMNHRAVPGCAPIVSLSHWSPEVCCGRAERAPKEISKWEAYHHRWQLLSTPMEAGRRSPSSVSPCVNCAGNTASRFRCCSRSPGVFLAPIETSNILTLKSCSRVFLSLHCLGVFGWTRTADWAELRAAGRTSPGPCWMRDCVRIHLFSRAERNCGVTQRPKYNN